MKKISISLLSLAALFFSCQKVELNELGGEMSPGSMKTITLSAGVGESDTKAALDAREGFFKWQTGDVISVLATDGKFYDFTLTEGEGNWRAEFKGEIPEGAQVTTLATYPAFVGNGAENTIYSENTLNFTLPTEYIYAHESTNVPMVASFAEGAEDLTFSHVGGVMRFPINNLPANATVTVTMHDKTITGAFSVDVTKLGETVMTAGSGASQVTIKYVSDQPLQRAEINLPVPAGLYNNFNLTVTDGSGQVTVSKDYTSKSNVVKRSTLLLMSQIGFVDNGVGAEPDDTDYDAFRLGKMPISFWWTVPGYAHNYDDALTREKYAEMAESGINLVIYNGEVDCSYAENKRVNEIVEELGMKFIGNVYAPTIEERIALIQEHLATSPNYIGEYVADEPSAYAFDELAQFVDKYLETFPDKEAYINLYPMYTAAHKFGTEVPGNQLKSYEEHINQYLNKVKTKTLSYDYYGLLTNGLGGDFYTNLDLVRSRTLHRKMPFWVITQTGQIPGVNRMPTEKEERWSVWATLAGGSKGISYFCYWSPWDEAGQQTGMINRDGSKSAMYHWIKKINADIQTIGNKLMYCHADGMILTAPKYYPLYDNNGAGRTNYGPVKAVSGSTSIACGCFRDARKSENGDNYKGYKALVVSQMPTRDAKAYLTIDSSVSEVTITHLNTAQTVQLTNTLNTTVGDITVKFDGARLTLEIPEGEAAFLEF